MRLLLSTCICEVGWGWEEAKGWGWYYLPVFARLDGGWEEANGWGCCNLLVFARLDEVVKRLKDEVAIISLYLRGWMRLRRG